VKYLIIFRHGPAEDRLEYQKQGLEDSTRNLTSDGRVRTKKAAKGLKKLVKGDFVIVSSPFNRAKQTAEILQNSLESSSDIIFSSALEPDSHPAEFVDLMKKQEAEFVIAVGHEPHLSSLASFVVFKDPSPYKIKLKKAGALAIRCGKTNDDETEFLWLMTPKQLSI